MSDAVDPLIDLQEYLRAVERRLGQVDLGLVARRRVSLDSLYAEAPSSSLLSLEVRAGRAVRWAITDPDSVTSALAAKTLIKGPGVNFVALRDYTSDRISASMRLDLAAPFSRPLPFTPLWQDGIKREVIALSLANCVGVFPRLVVTGPPGSGKSTFSRHLAVSITRAMNELGSSGDMRYYQSWRPAPTIPIFVDLRAFVDVAEWPDEGVQQISTEALHTYMADTYLSQGTATERSALRRTINNGGCVFIFDGLDEVRVSAAANGMAARRAQLTYFVDLIEREFAPSRILLTSRDYAYTGWAIPQFVHVRMGILGNREVFELVRRILAQVDEISPDDLDRHAVAMVAKLVEIVPESLRERPLFVTLLAGVYSRRVAVGRTGLPTKPVELYEESISLLLGRWASETGVSLIDRLGCTLEQLRERLESIAYLGQRAEAEVGGPTADGFGDGFTDVVLLRELVVLPGRVNYQEIIGYLNRDTGLILSPAPGRYHFAHRSFQEYLAACHLARIGSESAEWASLPKDFASAPIAWRETLRQLCALLIDRGRRDELWSLIDSLLTADEAATAWPVWLAGVLARELVVTAPTTSRRNLALVRDLLAETDIIQESPSTLPTVERCELRAIRGLLRRVVDGPGVPLNPDWCHIPGGEFLMGLSETDQQRVAGFQASGTWLMKREMPAHLVSVGAFRISRYTVTRAQFAAFLAASDGYYDDANWSPEFRPYRHPSVESLLDDPTGSLNPDLPRTDVSWFDATAYCAWLTRKLGHLVSLPHEAQWEKAARGLDGRLFPWGDGFAADAANSRQTGIGDLSAVGAIPLQNCYWGDDSPSDMSGNVWEWCTTICEFEGGIDYGYPYGPDDGREAPSSDVTALRIVRGGCYISPPHQIMATFRGRDRPNMRMYRQGFRVVAPPEQAS